jgi:hypothetical protein
VVIVLQLCLFAAALLIRGRFLLGLHLKQVDGGLEYKATSKSHVIYHFGINQADGIPFIIRKERWYHRLLKAIGIAEEIQLVDANINRTFFFTTDFPSHLEQAMYTHDIHKYLHELQKLGVKTIHATPTRMWCTLPRMSKEDDPSAGAHIYRQHLQAISKATQATPVIGYPARMLNYYRTHAIAVILVHAAFLGLGLFGILPTLLDSVDTVDWYEWLIKSLIFASILIGVWLAHLLYCFKHTSWICWVLADFLLCGLVGMLASSLFIVREINMDFPQRTSSYMRQVMQNHCEIKCSKSCGRRCTRHSTHRIQPEDCTVQMRPQTYERIRARDYICRDGRANYHFAITIPHWKGEKGTYHFDATTRQYDQMPVGTAISIDVNHGALGLEWVDTEAIKPYAGQ